MFFFCLFVGDAFDLVVRCAVIEKFIYDSDKITYAHVVTLISKMYSQNANTHLKILVTSLKFIDEHDLEPKIKSRKNLSATNSETG